MNLLLYCISQFNESPSTQVSEDKAIASEQRAKQQSDAQMMMKSLLWFNALVFYGIGLYVAITTFLQYRQVFEELLQDVNEVTTPQLSSNGTINATAEILVEIPKGDVAEDAILKESMGDSRNVVIAGGTQPAATSNSRSDNLKGTAKKMINSHKKASVKRKFGKRTTTKTSSKKNTKADDSFGACLLIKDDNHWLIEWLAYHYHVLPLRHLMVAVDPTSQTSPLAILNRWKPLMESLVVWIDKDFMPSNAAMSKELKQLYKNNTQLRDHRVRQTTFYAKCLQHFKDTGKVNWVQLTDTDEFTSLNYKDSSYDVQKVMQQHPIEEPGSVLQFLHRQTTGQAPKCIYINRYNVGSAESALVKDHQPAIKNLKTQDFLTQQFFMRSPKVVQYGKNVVHLGNMSLLKSNPNVHRVSLHCPSKEESLKMESTSYLKASHYIGTPEQFFARSDPRAHKDIGSKANKNARDMKQYQALNRTATKSDSSTKAWLSGFVELVGLEHAANLLQGVGQVGVE